MHRFPHEAMLLAAGLGRRMMPLTETTPKPLLGVAGKPLIDWVIGNARAEGIGRLVVNLHHHADQMRRHLDGLRSGGLEIVVSDEAARLLDTGGGVRHALAHLGGDPVLVMNSDAFWIGADQPIARLAETHAATGAEVTLLGALPQRATGFRRSHDFCLDPDRRITLDAGVPVIYAGVVLIGRHMFEGSPEGPFSLTLLFDRARAAGRLYGTMLEAPWHHVGDVAAIAEAEAALRAPA